MDDPEPLRLQLELRSAGAVPAGHLIGPDGEPDPFEGWLQLFGALERAIGGAENTGASSPSRR